MQRSGAGVQSGRHRHEPERPIGPYLYPTTIKTRTIPKPMTTPGSETFYGSIPVFRGFGSLMDPALYSPLPDDWTIGIADVVESTKAIAERRYKAVNMAGA